MSTTAMHEAFKRARVTKATPDSIIALCLNGLERALLRQRREAQRRARVRKAAAG